MTGTAFGMNTREASHGFRTEGTACRHTRDGWGRAGRVGGTSARVGRGGGNHPFHLTKGPIDSGDELRGGGGPGSRGTPSPRIAPRAPQSPPPFGPGRGSR